MKKRSRSSEPPMGRLSAAFWDPLISLQWQTQKLSHNEKTIKKRAKEQTVQKPSHNGQSIKKRSQWKNVKKLTKWTTIEQWSDGFVLH